MIPRDYVTAWRATGPWVEDAQVEQDLVISRAMFEQNLDGKLRDPSFGADMSGLLAAGREWDANAGVRVVAERLLSRLPGGPWQGQKLGTTAP